MTRRIQERFNCIYSKELLICFLRQKIFVEKIKNVLCRRLPFTDIMDFRQNSHERENTEIDVHENVALNDD